MFRALSQRAALAALSIWMLTVSLPALAAAPGVHDRPGAFAP